MPSYSSRNDKHPKDTEGTNGGTTGCNAKEGKVFVFLILFNDFINIVIIIACADIPSIRFIFFCISSFFENTFLIWLGEVIFCKSPIWLFSCGNQILNIEVSSLILCLQPLCTFKFRIHMYGTNATFQVCPKVSFSVIVPGITNNFFGGLHFFFMGNFPIQIALMVYI
ncbi:hypothetical protein SDC9_139618 [bioreactor metagenome]|uniref:Uncharacterized protein n=1 Tax=bioreactor metagenome TaxID=1076179 RepID=A0A645DV69_9ZZZZ